MRRLTWSGAALVALLASAALASAAPAAATWQCSASAVTTSLAGNPTANPVSEVDQTATAVIEQTAIVQTATAQAELTLEATAEATASAAESTPEATVESTVESTAEATPAS